MCGVDNFKNMRAALLLLIMRAAWAQHMQPVHPYIADQGVHETKTGMHVGEVTFVTQNESWMVPFHFTVLANAKVIPFLVDTARLHTSRFEHDDFRWHSCYAAHATMCCVMHQQSMFINPPDTPLWHACESVQTYRNMSLGDISEMLAFKTTLGQRPVRVWSEQKSNQRVTITVSLQTNATHSWTTQKRLQAREHAKRNVTHNKVLHARARVLGFGVLFVLAPQHQHAAPRHTHIESLFKHILIPEKAADAAQSLYQTCGKRSKPTNSVWRPHSINSSSLCSWACRPGFVRCLASEWWNTSAWDNVNPLFDPVKSTQLAAAYQCVPLRYRGMTLHIKVRAALPPMRTAASFTQQLVRMKVHLASTLHVSPCNIQIFHNIANPTEASPPRRRLLESNADTIELMLYTDEIASSHTVLHTAIKQSLLLTGLDVRDMTVDELFATEVYSPLRDLVVVSVWFTCVLIVLIKVFLPYIQQPCTACMAFITVALIRRKTFAIVSIALLLITYALSAWSSMLDSVVPRMQQTNIVRFGFLWGCLLAAVTLLVVLCLLTRLCKSQKNKT